MLVHLFGGALLPSCTNNALKKTADNNREDFDLAAVETVKQNNSVSYYPKDFRLRKWIANWLKEASLPPTIKDCLKDRQNISTASNYGFRQNTDPLLTPYKINGKRKIKKAQNYQWDPIQVHQ